MDSTEVQQQQYSGIMGTNPSIPKFPAAAVNNITWFDAVLYCNARSRRAGLDTVYSYSVEKNDLEKNPAIKGVVPNPHANGFRLPSEDQFEFAIMGGRQTDFFWGEDLKTTGLNPGDFNKINKYVIWEHFFSEYTPNQNNLPQPVATILPNAYGLYNMVGNLSEWCEDFHHALDLRENRINYVETKPSHQRSKKGVPLTFNQIRTLTHYHRSALPPTNGNRWTGFRTVLPMSEKRIKK